MYSPEAGIFFPFIVPRTTTFLALVHFISTVIKNEKVEKYIGKKILQILTDNDFTGWNVNRHGVIMTCNLKVGNQLRNKKKTTNHTWNIDVKLQQDEVQ